jgi:hypothetical protein
MMLKQFVDLGGTFEVMGVSSFTSAISIPNEILLMPQSRLATDNQMVPLLTPLRVDPTWLFASFHQ